MVDVQRPRPEFIPTRRARQDDQASKSRTQPPPRKIHRCLLPDPRHSLSLERLLRPCRVSQGIEADLVQIVANLKPISKSRQFPPAVAPISATRSRSWSQRSRVSAISIPISKSINTVRPSASTSEVQPLGATTHLCCFREALRLKKRNISGTRCRDSHRRYAFQRGSHPFVSFFLMIT